MLRCYERYVNDYQENATIPRTGVDSSQGRGTKRRRNEGWTVFGRDKGMGRYGEHFCGGFSYSVLAIRAESLLKRDNLVVNPAKGRTLPIDRLGARR